MLVYLCCGHVEYYRTIRYISCPFGIFCGHLVNFSPFWYVVPRKIWQPCQRNISKSFIETPFKKTYFFRSEPAQEWRHHRRQLDRGLCRRWPGASSTGAVISGNHDRVQPKVSPISRVFPKMQPFTGPMLRFKKIFRSQKQVHTKVQFFLPEYFSENPTSGHRSDVECSEIYLKYNFHFVVNSGTIGAPPDKSQNHPHEMFQFLKHSPPTYVHTYLHIIKSTTQ
jgi:hypothetical protein